MFAIGIGKTSSGCRDDHSHLCPGVKCQSQLEETGLGNIFNCVSQNFARPLSTLSFHCLFSSFTPRSLCLYLHLSLPLSLQAMQLLNLLLLTPSHCPSFSLHLSELDPLPVIHDGSFRKFHEQQQLLREANDQNSLEQEMNRFIKAGQSLSITTRGPGLRRLTDMIRSCRSDVSHLLRNGCDSVLRLVRGLVGVASPLVTTPTVAMEMGRCLGELGGLDLNCIALPTVPVKGESFSHTKALSLK